MNSYESEWDDAIREIYESERFKKIERFLASRFHDVVEEIKTIAGIPSPTFFESEKSNYVLSRFKALNLEEIRIDEVNNVIGKLTGEADDGIFIICAHIDTVFPMETELVVREQGDRLYCPSIGDNSTSIAGVLAIIEAFQRARFTPAWDVIFLANSREEGLGDLEGVRRFFDDAAMSDDAPAIKGMISIDGTYDSVCNQGIGSRRLKVVVNADGGHSWKNFGNASAIHAMGGAISEIAKLKTPEDPKTTYNVGVVNGGSSVNTIAETATMLIDIRSAEAGTLKRTEEKIRKVILEAMADFKTTCEIEVVGDRPSGFIPDSHPMVQTALSAASLYGLDATPRASSTDSNIPLSRGVPSITLGVYSGNGAHTVNEYIEPASLKKGLPSAALAILGILDRLASDKGGGGAKL
ncbi:MAG: M20/M25/M40 family metallo-hydrolase [Desulfobacterales bacterium]|nr:M20/M25/M40 family metallo-hydrolase [Desulfobacterales bacterium]